MDNAPILPLDFVVDVTTQTQSIIQSKPTVAQPTVMQISMVQAEEYWAKKGVHAFYNKGALLGGGQTSKSDLEIFLRLFRKILEEVVRTELAQKELTSEEFKDDFKMLDAIYNILNARIKKAGISTNNDRVLATFHGFINSFTGSSTNG